MFVSVEGCDFIGKTKLCGCINTHMQNEFSQIRITHEPGATSVGEDIRAILHDHGLAPMTELFLFLADRVEHVDKRIKNWVKYDNHLLICDRYIDSSYVYQGLSGVPEETIDRIVELCKFPIPDLTLVLTCDKETLWRRVHQNSSRASSGAKPIARWDVFERQMPIQEMFIKRANKYPERMKIVHNGDQPFDTTVENSIALIKQHRGEK